MSGSNRASIRESALAWHRGFIYPASFAVRIQAPAVEVREVLAEMAAGGELSVWEVPFFGNRSFEEEAKRGRGNRFEGLVDDADFSEIHHADVTAAVAYRRP